MSTINELIIQFELQVSDTTELSEAEEYIVANRVHNKICNQRPWEFLKTEASGSILTDSNGAYITLPSNFAYFCENNQKTDNTSITQNNAAPKVIFVGTSYVPYQIINYSDRRQYRNKRGYAYLDMANNQIRFTYQPEEYTYEFDYIKVPATLVSGSSLAFPARFEDALVYGMAVDDQIIQLSPKATSYAPENQAKYQSTLDDMVYWNAQLTLN